MNMILSDTQKAAAFDRLITEGKISVSDVEIFLNDFTNTLARARARVPEARGQLQPTPGRCGRLSGAMPGGDRICSCP